MRMMDFALFVIFLEMSIGFIVVLGDSNAFGSPGNNFFKAEQGGKIAQYQQNATPGVAGEIGTMGTVPKADILTFGMDFILAGFQTLMMIAESFVAFSWILYSQFHIDPVVCTFLQGIIYIVYLWGFLQWKSGRGGRMFE
jgi:hypothetical protein